MLTADLQGLPVKPASLCAILLYFAVTKLGPVIVQALKEDRESKRKHELLKLRLKKQIEDRRAQRKEEPK